MCGIGLGLPFRKKSVTLAVGNYAKKRDHVKEKKNPDWMCLEVAETIKHKHNKWQISKASFSYKLGDWCEG